MNITGLLQVAILALATAGISVTVSKSRGFAPLRNWVNKHNTFIGDLMSCPFCMNNLVAIALTATYRPVIIQLWIGIDLFVSLAGMISIAAIISGIIIKLNSFRDSAEKPDSNMNNSNRSYTNR